MLPEARPKVEASPELGVSPNMAPVFVESALETAAKGSACWLGASYQCVCQTNILISAQAYFSPHGVQHDVPGVSPGGIRHVRLETWTPLSCGVCLPLGLWVLCRAAGIWLTDGGRGKITHGRFQRARPRGGAEPAARVLQASRRTHGPTQLHRSRCGPKEGEGGCRQSQL